MKRESELELPVPGGGGDGAEPGLSKRPRTEEAAADGGGGMQVTARDGSPLRRGCGAGAARAAGVPGPGGGGPAGVLAWRWEGAGRGLVGKVGRAPRAWRRRVQEDPWVPERVPIPRGARGSTRE